MDVISDAVAGAVPQDRACRAGHPLARRRPRLADGHQEPQCARHRLLRAGQRLHVPGGRSAGADAEFRRHAGGRAVPTGGLHAAHPHSRSPSCTATTSRTSRWPIPGRTSGARACHGRLWADAVNRRGGNVTVVHLPRLGIRGNTHFPFSDLNNVEIADLMSEFLERHGLD